MEAGMYAWAAISWVVLAACFVKRKSSLEQEVKLQLEKTLAVLEGLPPAPRSPAVDAGCCRPELTRRFCG